MQIDSPKDFSYIIGLIKDAQFRAVKAVNTELINLYTRTSITRGLRQQMQRYVSKRELIDFAY